MKKWLLKVGVLILCITMCLCSTFSALAAWIPLAQEDSTKGQIQIKVTLDGEVTTSMHATAFRIIKVSVQDVSENPDDGDPQYQPADPVYTWAPGVAAWVAKHHPTYIDVENNNAVTEAYTKWYNEDKTPAEEIVPFIDALAAAIKSRDTDIKFEWDEESKKFVEDGDYLVASANFGTDKTATIDKLSKGSFIVLIEGGNQIYQPSVANLTPIWREAEGTNPAGWYVDSPVELLLKHTGVGIVKAVSETKAGPYGPAVTSSMGDRVYFKITADVPQYSDKAIAKTFTIRDTASAGLTFTDTLKIVGVKADGTTGSELTKGTDYTLTTEPDSGEFTVAFTYNETVAGYEKVEITYDTLVSDKAVTGSVGNPNTAYLDYANDPYSANSLKTIEDKATVYTYGMELTKTTTGSTPSPLGGAEFTLERQVEGVWQEVQFKRDSAGVYHHVRGSGVTRVVSSSETDNKGKIVLSGLDAGEYRVKEVVAPAGGYVLLKDYVYLTIADTVNAAGKEDTIDGIPDTNGANLTGDLATKGFIARSIPNSKGFDLPLTGGMGTLLFTAGGIVLVVGAVVLLLVANRKKSRRS